MRFPSPIETMGLPPPSPPSPLLPAAAASANTSALTTREASACNASRADKMASTPATDDLADEGV
ncbi:hypothetical protein Ctob_008019 [Chrysochromulina tobinii]|uniref:Uncharacterized protein n=1 Tax=Chrysochromulina tobinii TaxID=1460289 RepID=A0A0M0JGV7_9EUKA|nr:hypothetical protein Ctob_008019 [Chrysochromulina tobinii]|eukprot:KOO25824.1 hypothetical protein Ctob_008019 [Chrysochromulina sp. CCMP291]